jgi:hypothetical protein
VGQEIDADVEKSADRGLLKRRIKDIFRVDEEGSSYLVYTLTLSNEK